MTFGCLSVFGAFTGLTFNAWLPAQNLVFFTQRSKGISFSGRKTNADEDYFSQPKIFWPQRRLDMKLQKRNELITSVRLLHDNTWGCGNKYPRIPQVNAVSMEAGDYRVKDDRRSATAWQPRAETGRNTCCTSRNWVAFILFQGERQLSVWERDLNRSRSTAGSGDGGRVCANWLIDWLFYAVVARENFGGYRVCWFSELNGV